MRIPRPAIPSAITDGGAGRWSTQLAAGFSGRLSTWGYDAGWTLSRRLPESVVAGVFDQIGGIATKRDGRGVQQLRRNLARVHPELERAALDDLVSEAMKSYLRYWREAFRLPEWSRAEIERRISATGEHRLFDPLDDKRGVVAVLGHFGNWDHGGAWVTGRGYPLMTVAERLRPESLFDQFLEYRESLGMQVLPLTGGPDVTQLLQERLREGGLVALLADRDLTTTGIEVDLLGAPARMPVGPALLAERSGAALLPVLSWYEGGVTRLDFRPPLESSEPTLRARLHDVTQQWATIVGEAARQHARDWHMLQPVWVADRRRHGEETGE
jgi:phosphatidylinositol dimannoside acyltransferase